MKYCTLKITDAMGDRSAQKVEVWSGNEYIGLLPAIEVQVKIVPAQLPVLAVTVFAETVKADSHIVPDQSWQSPHRGVKEPVTDIPISDAPGD